MCGRPPTDTLRDSAYLQSENREKKWDTLVHAGVLFPPEYEPHGVRMLYEGKPVELTAEQVWRPGWRLLHSSCQPP